MSLFRARSNWSLAAALIFALSACSTPPAEPVRPVSGAQVIAEPQGEQYFVIGEVAVQGGQAFDGDVTLFEAVTRAQPRKQSANLGRVRLIRADPRDPTVHTIDVRRIIETGDSTYNVHIQAGDIIHVPAAEPK